MEQVTFPLFLVNRVLLITCLEEQLQTPFSTLPKAHMQIQHPWDLLPVLMGEEEHLEELVNWLKPGAFPNDAVPANLATASGL